MVALANSSTPFLPHGMRAKASCTWAMATAATGVDGGGRCGEVKRRARRLNEHALP
jgi:hypothetical protein